MLLQRQELACAKTRQSAVIKHFFNETSTPDSGFFTIVITLKKRLHIMADQNKDPDKNSEQTGNSKASTKAKTETKTDDAVTLLKNDHRTVEKLFAQYEKANRRPEKEELARKICRELIIHTKIEEEIFYPACREYIDDEPLDEAQVEHDGAKILITELLAGTPSEPYYDAKVKVLSEMIKHHVNEEEKRNDGIFAKAKAGGLDTEEVAQALTARKAELTAEAEQNEPERPRPRSFTHMMETPMAQSQYRDRDSRGRFTSDDDYDDRRSASSQSRNRRSRYEDDGRRGSMQDRDEYGRFAREYDDDDMYDDRRYSSSRSRSGSRYDDDRGRSMSERDDQGRFASSDTRGRGGNNGRYDYEDDRSYSRRGRQRDDQGRYMSDEDDDYDRRYSRSRSSQNRDWRDEDDDDRGSGWYGDSQGHARAARRGWEDRR